MFELLLSDYTTRVVALGVALIGAACGALGCFAILRRQSLLGDAMSHAALPGVVLGFMLSGSKAPAVLLAGAAFTGILAAGCVVAVRGIARLRQDTMLGIVLSVFFGGGIVLLSLVQRWPAAGKAGLDKFLFGSAATLLAGDLLPMLFLAAVTGLLLLAFWPRFKLLSFDIDFMRSIGIASRPYEILLTIMMVLAIVMGLQTVGVVLMSAMLIAPAAAARQWTDRLPLMALLAALLGALGGVCGVLISSLISRMPTGPVIVVVLSIFVLASSLFAPQRGLLPALLRELRARASVRREAILLGLLHLAAQHRDPFYPHEAAAIRALGHRVSVQELRSLKDDGLVELPQPGTVRLSAAGLQEARRLLELHGLDSLDSAGLQQGKGSLSEGGPA
jgi:manganese/zinc/iron transport system permease protein